MEPIIKNKVRILRPDEYGSFRAILNAKQQLWADGLLTTGVRYVEGRTLQGHIEWLDGQFIKTHSKKAETKFKDRWIRLSDYGRLVVPNFIKGDRLPSRQTFDINMKRWAEKAGISAEGMCCKTFRKTWESWLVFYYPSHQVEIATRQGHTAITQLAHYLDMPFSNEDRYKMEVWIRGWLGEDVGEARGCEGIIIKR